MTFLTLIPADDPTLHWRQPSILGSRHVMASDRGELAAMDFTNGLSSSASASCASGVWQFLVKGSWQPRVIVTRSGQDAPFATLEITNAWLGNRAELTTDDAIAAVWESTGFLSGSARWVTTDDQPLVTFRSGTDEGGAVNWLKTQCRVDLSPNGYEHPHRDLLLCIGWVLTVLQANPAI
ncbi:MAG TPA: hypothetical protein VE869_01480 [Gemmatimonas sp.]|nr:hypothetical protein [Gemmatimonas sp.]